MCLEVNYLKLPMNSDGVGIFVLGWGANPCCKARYGSWWCSLLSLNSQHFHMDCPPRSFQPSWLKTTTWEHLGAKGKYNLPVYYQFNNGFYAKALILKSLELWFSWLGLSMAAHPCSSLGVKEEATEGDGPKLSVAMGFPSARSVKVWPCQSCWRLSCSFWVEKGENSWTVTAC